MNCCVMKATFTLWRAFPSVMRTFCLRYSSLKYCGLPKHSETCLWTREAADFVYMTTVKRKQIIFCSNCVCFFLHFCGDWTWKLAVATVQLPVAGSQTAGGSNKPQTTVRWTCPGRQKNDFNFSGSVISSGNKKRSWCDLNDRMFCHKKIQFRLSFIATIIHSCIQCRPFARYTVVYCNTCVVG